MKKTFLAIAVFVIALGLHVSAARANDFVLFNQDGGHMRNYYVDLVFWGNNFNSTDRSSVKQAVTDFGNWLNTGWVNGSAISAGSEPAIHYYGLSAISPGMWINDPMPPPTSGTIDDSQIRQIVTLAQNGTLGQAFDYGDNVANTPGLPPSPNRLTLVITKGTNNFCADGGCYTGYHEQMSNNPYGAVRI